MLDVAQVGTRMKVWVPRTVVAPLQRYRSRVPHACVYAQILVRPFTNDVCVVYMHRKYKNVVSQTTVSV
jgi:hypothetical protein